MIIDATALTYDFRITELDDPEKPDRDKTAPVDYGDVAPATYGFGQPATAFAFELTAAGTVDYATELDGFLGGKGTDTLIVKGYPVTLDATALDQDLVLLGQFEGLPRTTTHQLVLVPWTHGFICSSALVSSFNFVLDNAGLLSIAPEDVGFAAVNNDTHTLTVSGYAITFDGTLLTQDLFPLILRIDGAVIELSRKTEHTLTLIPSGGYGMIVGGVAGKFVYQVNHDGTVSFAPIYSGFLKAEGARLVLVGYPVVIDSSKPDIPLLDAPITRWFGLQVLIPAKWPVETVDGTVYVFTLELDGTVTVDPADTQSYKIGSVPRVGLGG